MEWIHEGEDKEQNTVILTSKRFCAEILTENENVSSSSSSTNLLGSDDHAHA